MKIFIAIDDTDDIGTKGTGEILEELCIELSNRFEASFSRVTRHQLLVHEDIKYTSHNSSMCCEGIIKPTDLEYIKEEAIKYLKENCAPNSDPGLCIVKTDIDDRHIKRIMDWGKRAKTFVLSKIEAYSLAEETGIHLSEHGGTGDGIIGAMAGIGLRLSGNDGRFKGKFDLNVVNGHLTVKEICCSDCIDIVLNENFEELQPDEKVFIGDKLKTVLFDHRAALLVKKNKDGCWVNLTRKEIKEH